MEMKFMRVKVMGRTWLVPDDCDSLGFRSAIRKMNDREGEVFHEITLLELEWNAFSRAAFHQNTLRSL